MKLEKEVKIQKNIISYNLKNFKEEINKGLIIEFLNKLSDEDVEILKKMKNLKVKLILEAEEPILDDAERKYLSGVIRPFRDRVRYIEKHAYICDGNKREFISINTNGGVTPLPYFKAETMYKGMELNKEYTLEELGL